MEPDEIWRDFDPITERVYSASGAEPQRIKIPERVIALRDIVPTDEEVEAGDTYGSRNKLAVQYAMEGDIVDTQIDVWGWGAENTYASRRGYGYETVPDCLGKYRIHTMPDTIPTSVL
jgi:hypothetical protein